MNAPVTSRFLPDLESLLAQLATEHRRLLAHLEAQQAAMRAMDLAAMDVARNQQEACRIRIAQIENKRRLLINQIAKLLRADAATLTLSKLAELHPQRRDALMKHRAELRDLAEQIRRRTHVAGKLANALLGHLNTVVRLLAGAVERAGIYTKTGIPRVSSRIGVMEAVGEDGRSHEAPRPIAKRALATDNWQLATMSLSGALNVGKTALATHQAAIQVTGNNIANAGNADFTRQTSVIAPGKDQQVRQGLFIGTGVDLTGVKRQIDEALEGRLRGSVSDNEAADTYQQWLGRVESVFNELGEDDLSTRLSTYFSSWSNLANKPQDIGLRQVVIQNGDSVASWLRDLRNQLGNLQRDVDTRLVAQTRDANGLADQIAELNGQIVVAEGGGTGQANGLRDRRDAVLKQLSQLVDVRTVQQENGVANVYVGSEPLVFGTTNRGVALKQDVTDGKTASYVVFKNDGGTVPLKDGQIGGLVDARKKIGEVVDEIDLQARNLIFELNKVHSSGQGLDGFASVTAVNQVADATVALNDPLSGLHATPMNGSFVVHVRQKATGLVTSTLVQVDLDGTGAETTLNSLRADLNAITDVGATITGGKLTVAAGSDAVEVTFSQDSSGVLAALGINTFFTGKDARDIGVNQVVKDKPMLLAAARNGERGDNQTARLIAGLETHAITALDGSTLKDRYQGVVNSVGVAAASAKTDAEATRVVKETLEAQRESLSGVSLDEEAINLMRQQRAFQGAARLVSAVDEMMQTLLAMAR